MRRLLALLLLVLALPVSAQQYPAQSIKLIVAFPPGGGADAAARILAASLGEQLGQSVVVENYAGAGGTIGTARAAHAAPDGYTLLVGTPSTHGANTAVYEHLNYDPVKDFAPVMLIGSSPFMLLATPSFEAKSVKDLIAAAKANPGRINYASYGNGSINHLAGELFASLADINVTHVPYRGGGPAMVDLIAGRVQYEFDGTASIGQVKAGKVKILAVTSKERWSVFPDVPTVAETVPGFDAITWYGLFAPAGTPKAIVDLLNAKANAAIRTKAAVDGLNQLSIDPGGGSPDVLAKQVRGEIDKWVDIARKRNIRITE
ncbi:MAG TPA: tripartite tricarboxylate transporter substrate binding protein [Casimicrobiaceae bacterium]|jgi:tripartite-type tricarboxylate transporter receptor subunit TctC|nr:tripartite tricarboxylate transporter substrate binding protein [Casimicrobiaceae bacterium]